MKLLDLPPEPWRNGGGVTRTVARGDENAGGELWRVSAAEITASGAFSRFPNMDRQAMLIAGGPLTLVVACTPHAMARVGDTVRFTGEADSAVTLSGQPARFWNAMTRRGLATLQLSLRYTSEGAMHLQASAKATHIALVLAGRALCHQGGADAMHQAGHLLVLREGEAILHPEGDDTVFLLTTITTLT